MSSGWWTLWTSLVLGAVVLIAFWWRRYSTQFARRGVPYAAPVFLAGNMLDVVLGRKSLHDVIVELYQKLEPHPYAGVFAFRNPLVLIRDPEIIRSVTVKDFDHFTDHIDFINSEDMDPLQKRMLNMLKGKEWHDMRCTLSPAFTSMKMKNMFVLMTEIGQQMVDYLTKETAEYEASSCNKDVLTLELKDFFTRITNDVIATVAFGVKVDSLSEPTNTFYSMGRKLTSIKATVAFAYMMFPKLMRLLGTSFIDQKMAGFFKSMVCDTIRTREKQGIVRHDMIHLLMQARRGELASEEGEKNETTKNNGRHLTDNDIAAQAMIFFFAGFETVSTVMTFCSYLLATHEDVQRRLQQQVDDLMQSSGGQPTYEQVMGCEYLDMVLSETLRMYTPLSALDRTCVRSYRLPATESCPGLEMQAGDGIWVPIRGIHYDPKYYAEPKRFDPERFSSKNKHLIKPFTYFPFGSGPRVCIAQRFALLEMKVLLLYFLSRFSFEAVAKTPMPLEIQANNASLLIKGGAWLGIRPRS